MNRSRFPPESEVLKASRAAYNQRDWTAARDGFLAARAQEELAAEDLDALGGAAWWMGYVEESLDAYEAAYRRYLHGDHPRQAATAAIGIAMNLLLRGEDVMGSGWVSRAQRNRRYWPSRSYCSAELIGGLVA